MTNPRAGAELATCQANHGRKADRPNRRFNSSDGGLQREWETDEEYGKHMYDYLNNHDIYAEKYK